MTKPPVVPQVRSTSIYDYPFAMAVASNGMVDINVRPGLPLTVKARLAQVLLDQATRLQQEVAAESAANERYRDMADAVLADSASRHALRTA